MIFLVFILNDKWTFFCCRTTGCLADPENPEMGMGDPENPKNPENRLLNYPRTLKMQSVLPY